MENTIDLFAKFTESLSSLNDKQKEDLIKIIKSSMDHNRSYEKIVEECINVGFHGYDEDNGENRESIFMKKETVYDIDSFLEHITNDGWCYRVYIPYGDDYDNKELCTHCKINYKRYLYK